MGEYRSRAAANNRSIKSLALADYKRRSSSYKLSIQQRIVRVARPPLRRSPHRTRKIRTTNSRPSTASATAPRPRAPRWSNCASIAAPRRRRTEGRVVSPTVCARRRWFSIDPPRTTSDHRFLRAGLRIHPRRRRVRRSSVELSVEPSRPLGASQRLAFVQEIEHLLLVIARPGPDRTTTRTARAAYARRALSHAASTRRRAQRRAGSSSRAHARRRARRGAFTARRLEPCDAIVDIRIARRDDDHDRVDARVADQPRSKRASERTRRRCASWTRRAPPPSAPAARAPTRPTPA